MDTESRGWLLVAVTMLNSYSLGASCVERFVNYATWPEIPPPAFEAYHRAQSSRIQLTIVLPLAVGLVLQVALLIAFLRSGLPVAAIWTMIAASVAGSASTVALQLPIHRRFERYGYSPDLWQALMRTDWIRKAADAIRMAATIILLYRALQ